MLASRLPVQTEAHRSQDRSRLTIQPGTVYPACLPIRPIQVLHAFDPISCSARLSASESLIVTIHWAFQPFGVAGRRQRISAIMPSVASSLTAARPNSSYTVDTTVTGRSVKQPSPSISPATNAARTSTELRHTASGITSGVFGLLYPAIQRAMRRLLLRSVIQLPLP